MPRIEVEGLKELRAALKATGDDLGDLKDAGKKAAEIVAVEARTLVPVLSGALLATIRAAGQASGANVKAGMGRTLAYAGPVHFGQPQRGIPPHPFLYDALDHRRDAVVDAYANAVNKLTREYE